MGRISDSITGWTMMSKADGSGRPPPGGIVLEDIDHWGSTFAREIRLIGIRLEIEEVSPEDTVVGSRSHFLALTDPPFTIGTVEERSPTMIQAQIGRPNTFQQLDEFDDALLMKTYFQVGGRPTGYVVRADHVLPTKYIEATWPNSEFSEIRISQRFLFSPMSNVPPHEPGGVLTAARCHPITRYEVVPRPGGVNRPSQRRFRVGSIRFDYRLHLKLDSAYDKIEPGAPPRVGNNAGLFRDNESAASLAVPLVPLSGWAFSRVAFAAVEKPLLFEVAAYGLWEGAPLIGPRSSGQQKVIESAPHGWDNVHWWGARGLGQPMISAPGAFHAAHIHWRWGGAGSRLRKTIPEIDAPAVPPGKEDYWWQGEGMRILVDPAIWIQTLRVAITRNVPQLDPNNPQVTLESLCTENWETLFTSRGAPANIEAGDDIVLWYSAKVHRQTVFPAENDGGKAVRVGKTFRSANAGSVFLHGIFFAHGPEQGGSSSGSRAAQYRPKDARTLRAERAWVRNA